MEFLNSNINIDINFCKSENVVDCPIYICNYISKPCNFYVD
jgi:hypothetical protein